MNINLNKLTFGSWITIGSRIIGEIMANNDYDWLCIDLEHSIIDYREMTDLIISIETNNCFPFVRLPQNNEIYFKKVLDAGAKGIIIPKINNVEDALKAIKFANYSPIGERGVGLARAQSYGFKFNEYKNLIKKELKLIVQIEHREAIENLEDILALENIHGSIIGPYDLSSSFGKPGSFDDEEVLKALSSYEKIGQKYDKPIGFHFVDTEPQQIIKKIKQGYKFIGLGIDTLLLGKSSKDQIQNIKQLI